MCHGWRHVNYGTERSPSEFGPERPLLVTMGDIWRAFEAFAERFDARDAVFVPAFGRISAAVARRIPSAGFIALSTGMSPFERRISRLASVYAWLPGLRVPRFERVRHLDVHIDPIDWRTGTAPPILWKKRRQTTDSNV